MTRGLDAGEKTAHRTGRVAALDGLRGIAVLLVVVAHGAGATGAFNDAQLRLVLIPFDSTIGVTIFFVLSGYLITSILAREHQRAGRISLYNFYVRRVLRIMPAFYVLLAAVAIVAAAGLISVTAGSFASAGLFVWNYSPAAKGWWLGHTWSLAVEEQFYLLWPLLFAALRPRRAFLLAAVVVVASPVIRTVNYLVDPHSITQVGFMFHTRADSLLTGCLLALLPYTYPAAWARVTRFLERWPVGYIAVALLLLCSVASTYLSGAWQLPFGFTLTNVGAAGLLLTAILSDRADGVCRALQWKPLTLLGLISYSLYLWQQPLAAHHGHGMPIVGYNVWGVPLAVLLAILSYNFVEKPFLSLKERLQRRPLGVTPLEARLEPPL